MRNVGNFLMLFPWVQLSGGKSGPGEVVRVRVSEEDSELCALFPQRFKSCVYRRYNDFVVFHETLLHKFPYRMVPALPPKRMLGGNRWLCCGLGVVGVWRPQRLGPVPSLCERVASAGLSQFKFPPVI